MYVFEAALAPPASYAGDIVFGSNYAGGTSASGDRIAVGAWGAAGGSGAAFVYRAHAPGDWLLEAELIPDGTLEFLSLIHI